jgi:hypothetical protein
VDSDREKYAILGFGQSSLNVALVLAWAVYVLPAGHAERVCQAWHRAIRVQVSAPSFRRAQG